MPMPCKEGDQTMKDDNSVITAIILGVIGGAILILIFNFPQVFTAWIPSLP